LEQHLAGCSSCREQYAAATRLVQGLKSLPRIAAPPELARRIAGAVVRDRVVRRRRMKVRLYVTAALAASVFLMLLVSYSQQPSPNVLPHQVRPLAQNEVRPPEAPPDAPQRTNGADSLVERTREQLHMLLDALPAEVAVENLPGVPELEPLDPAAQSLKQAGLDVTASLQTVTRSARQALDYFSRELPVLDLGTRE
jgi:hypothetical protein